MELATKEEIRQTKLDSYWDNDLKLVFDDIAERYDKANDFFSFGVWTRLRRKFVAWADMPKNSNILDVCAGTNAVGIDLLLKDPTLNVTAIDRSEGMQKIGAQRAQKRGFNIKSVIKDVHSLPFDGETFHGVTLENATRHLEVKKVFAEIYRVLEPGGYFCHHDLVKPSNRVVSFFYTGYMKLMIPLTTLTFFRTTKFMGLRKSARGLSDYFIEAIDIFYTSDELTLILEEVGFRDIKVKSLMGGTVGFHKARK